MSVKIEDDKYSPPSGHWSIDEAMYNLSAIKERISRLGGLIENAKHSNNFLDLKHYEKELKYATTQEHGIQREIDIHVKRGLIQHTYDEKINGIKRIGNDIPKHDLIAAVRHKIALTVAEGEKKKHIFNLHKEKNDFQREATGLGYRPMTDIDGLFTKPQRR